MGIGACPCGCGCECVADNGVSLVSRWASVNAVVGSHFHQVQISGLTGDCAILNGTYLCRQTGETTFERVDSSDGTTVTITIDADVHSTNSFTEFLGHFTYDYEYRLIRSVVVSKADQSIAYVLLADNATWCGTGCGSSNCGEIQTVDRGYSHYLLDAATAAGAFATVDVTLVGPFAGTYSISCPFSFGTSVDGWILYPAFFEDPPYALTPHGTDFVQSDHYLACEAGVLFRCGQEYVGAAFANVPNAVVTSLSVTVTP